MLALALGLILPETAGAQAFAPESVVTTSANGANCVATADLDGDGDLDLVCAEFEGDRVSWYPQTGPGLFGEGKSIVAGIDGPWHLEVTDLDSDGDLDIAVTATYASQVMWFENADAGETWVQHFLSTTAIYPGGLCVADLDADGNQDILVASTADNKVTCFRNLGDGTFADQQVATSSIGGAWTLAQLDIDSDGDPDLVVGGWKDEGLSLLVNDGMGGLAAPVPIVVGTTIKGSSSLGGYDMDGDGDLDILSASRHDDSLAWFENVGVLGTMTQHIISSLKDPYHAEAVDIDGDGDLDVLAAAAGQSTITCHENLGDGVFAAATILTSFAAGARYVTIGDLDGDGDIDLVTAAFQDDTISTFENILPVKKAELVGLEGLHCLDSGRVQLTGVNLLNTTVLVDGLPVPVISINDTQLDLVLAPDVPGGPRTIELTNSYGTTTWSHALLRYPALYVPEVLELGKPIHVLIANGDTGLYNLAWSIQKYTSPAPFTAAGWYHGLELNGLWPLATGVFGPTTTSLSLVLPGTLNPALVGLPLYLQALTSQSKLGYAGFTDTRTMIFQ